MKSIVIYASRSGNTRTVAESIANGLRSHGPVEVLPVEQVPATWPEDTDLLVIGGPTEGHKMTPPMAKFLDGIDPKALQGLAAATFDTRLWWPRALSGSAASDIEKRLHGLGARVLVPPESFIVTMKPALKPGEVERAAAWADKVATLAERSQLAVAAPVG